MTTQVSRRRWVLAALTVSWVAGGCRSAVEDFYAPLARAPECGVSGSAGAAPAGGAGGGESGTGGAETGGQGGGPGAAGSGGCAEE